MASAPVSLDLLSEDEQHEYNRLLDNVARAEAGPTQWRYSMNIWIILFWVPLVALAFAPIFVAALAPDSRFSAALDATPAGTLWAIALMLIMLPTPVLIIVLVIRARRAWVRKHQPLADRALDGFLRRIKYEERARQSREGSNNDYDRRSTNLRNHQWYGTHSELNWQDRSTAQSWGMDADEYSQWQNSNDPD